LAKGRRPGRQSQPPARQPQKQAARQSSQVVAQHYEEHYQGPIPPADELDKYEQVEQGLANRIVSMAERQQTHRQALELRAVKSQHARSWAGLAAGWSVAIVGMLVAAYVAVEENAAAGTILGTVDLVALVSVFVYQRKQE
jgi:uncharacterized membrane protein